MTRLADLHVKQVSLQGSKTPRCTSVPSLADECAQSWHRKPLFGPNRPTESSGTEVTDTPTPALQYPAQKPSHPGISVAGASIMAAASFLCRRSECLTLPSPNEPPPTMAGGHPGLCRATSRLRRWRWWANVVQRWHGFGLGCGRKLCLARRSIGEARCKAGG
ncbi:hypothetical protein BDV95DRAFT_567092 [Massariosphaeria phaeospora]|uniref:Uncharacterized protein n=1 Tax=Massariosphaeria phaeospora TaxID=100035 RepID=A0A7C8IDE5_9PLEO|nr:hypothetical protein BDV95DRAFT_567092 [Massariosphaeria phaeospora]